MNKLYWITAAALCLSGIAQSGFAVETNNFTNARGDGDWNQPANWDPAKLPDPANPVRIMRGAEVKITTAVEIGALQMGTTGACSILIDGGSLSTTTPNVWSAISYHPHPCSLTIQNGGSATFAGNLAVGRKDSKGASVVVHKGTLRVQGIYGQNREVAGTKVINTRTTLHTGGVLDVDTLELGAGVIDIAGGSLIVRKSPADDITEWIKIGRIIAMGGLDGWIVKVDVNAETGWTTLTAVQEEILLGQRPPPSSLKNQLLPMG